MTTTDDEDTSLVEYGESPADYRRARRLRERELAQLERFANTGTDRPASGLIAAAGVVGLAGVGCAITFGLTPVAYTLFGIALPLAAIPVVRIARY